MSRWRKVAIVAVGAFVITPAVLMIVLAAVTFVKAIAVVAAA